MSEPICGYQGDPVCEPPDCSGACPLDKSDLKVMGKTKEALQLEFSKGIITVYTNKDGFSITVKGQTDALSTSIAVSHMKLGYFIDISILENLP